MGREITRKLIAWLRRKSPGSIIHLRDFWMEYAHMFGILPIHAQLSARVFRKDGTVEDLGVIGTHAVTDAFVAQLVDTLQSSEASFSTYKYHDSGTGTTAEATSDTTLVTPCGEARDVGTQAEGATANIYSSVATHTYADSFSITEHGLFNASTSGILADRTVFTAIDVDADDRIEFTYQLTCTSGG